MINVLNKTKNLNLELYSDEDDDEMTPLVSEKEEMKSEPEETIVERVKLNPRKRKKTGTGLKILSPNKLLPRLSILVAQ